MRPSPSLGEKENIIRQAGVLEKREGKGGSWIGGDGKRDEEEKPPSRTHKYPSVLPS